MCFGSDHEEPWAWDEGAEASSSRCTAVEKRFQKAGSRMAAIGSLERRLGVQVCGGVGAMVSGGGYGRGWP